MSTLAARRNLDILPQSNTIFSKLLVRIVLHHPNLVWGTKEIGPSEMQRGFAASTLSFKVLLTAKRLSEINHKKQLILWRIDDATQVLKVLSSQAQLIPDIRLVPLEVVGLRLSTSDHLKSYAHFFKLQNYCLLWVKNKSLHLINLSTHTLNSALST